MALTVDVDGTKTETITATDGHPFWLDGNGDQLTAKDTGRGHWTETGDLRTGDRRHAPKGGSFVAVLDSKPRAEWRTVYNRIVPVIMP